MILPEYLILVHWTSGFGDTKDQGRQDVFPTRWLGYIRWFYVQRSGVFGKSQVNQPKKIKIQNQKPNAM